VAQKGEKLIYQTDSEFPSSINHFGCYFMSLLERMTTHYDLSFTHDVALSIFNYGQDKGYIDEEVTLIDPQDLCDHVIGTGKIRFYGKYTPTYETQDNELEILCWHKSGASFNHFCSGNGKGVVFYDPWSETGSDSVRNGQLIGKRIYRVL
jgi:hypothetical protein